jgi:hypothetical protein
MCLVAMASLIAFPDSVASAPKDALARTAGLVASAYQLEMRVAAFPVAALRARGGDIRV